MARPFRGPFSPDNSTPTGAAPQPPRHRLESRTRWITVMATPLLISAFWQDPQGLALQLLAFAGIAGGMALTREGLRAEAAYDQRRVARRPALPRKLFGGVLTGLGLALGAWVPGAEAGAAVIGVAGAVLHWLAFGPDPMRDKGMEGVDTHQQDRAQRSLAEAEAHLRAMQDAILRTGDRRLEARVGMFAATARTLFAHVEDNPDTIAAVRRYLGIYLQGARDATVKFADLYAQTRDARARQDYETLLSDLETEFAARTRQLIAGNRTDLDIEIGVLRDRLTREGVRPAEPPALESGLQPADPLASLRRDKQPR
ncbi:MULTISPECIES: 5-bromo-4-chloroindolyl phosphate hydrolysis family protein [unclassified Paracoccus (in: a-proteobacteria)]|uniref:5-bromo-4-chloroindolyl phosphate hydrolysis family protein n=1 Tax=unclassified Paracoccus (in: a-proteobacteria) TaxID=2688777 RepID=UPI0012B1CE3E|nr:MULTISPECIES: 5-bromo-4-chloroindolyl phosphate hydrolysis family protein [unclassified Paracoccus (in: a-proteobacteria)]UXU75308.1 5-bromo-4-chloroindolyl phosphate hydrolysis family protein [Paracoccus sp. SMMA_5]UXU81210.1 5-bromo-4-chloroindolyl phosphate hydrolysis family protein [Paracoccus sp. SMMA_5_TC]